MFNVTIDNTSFNDGAIRYLKKKGNNWNGLVMKAKRKIIHVRCYAHILNIVVMDGLKKYYKSISTMIHVMRYFKASFASFVNFR